MSIKQWAKRPPRTEGAIRVPESVKHETYWAALDPFIATLGIDPNTILGRMSIADDVITVFSGLPVEGVEPERSGDGEGAIWVWPVRVKIEREGYAQIAQESEEYDRRSVARRRTDGGPA